MSNSYGQGREDIYVNAYRATILLRFLTGWGKRKIWRALLKLGYKVSINTVNHWLHHNKKHRFRPSSLEKALFYHQAYEMAIIVKKLHPNWGYKKISSYINKHLPIRVPGLTVYFWITGRSKLNITPIKPCPALGYLVGVLVGDHKRTKDGHGLSVKNKEFAKYYAKKYWETTGVKLKIHEKDGYWKTYDNAGWLKELWYSKLWKVVAYVYPLEFLKGLFDSEGAVSPRVDHKKRALYSVKISLVNGDREVIGFAKKILEDYGLKANEHHIPPKVKAKKGKSKKSRELWILYMYGWESLEKFATLIGFRESKRKRRILLLLKLRHLKPSERFKEWSKHYRRSSVRWEEKLLLFTKIIKNIENKN